MRKTLPCVGGRTSGRVGERRFCSMRGMSPDNSDGAEGITRSGDDVHFTWRRKERVLRWGYGEGLTEGKRNSVANSMHKTGHCVDIEPWVHCVNQNP